MRYLRRIFLSYSLNSGLCCCLCLIFTNSQLKALEKTKAEDVVATQLRAQGIPCTAPYRTEKDKLDSRPDEIAWIISCKEATYKVTLIPHAGANVDIVDPADFQLQAE